MALSLILTSCSGQPSNPGVAVEEKEGEELVIGVCIYDFKDDFMGLYKGELEQYLTEKYGAKVDFMDGRNSMEIQNQQLEEYLKKDPDAVIVNPVEALKTSALVDMCARRGVPAVIINREPPEEERGICVLFEKPPPPPKPEIKIPPNNGRGDEPPGRLRFE